MIGNEYEVNVKWKGNRIIDACYRFNYINKSFLIKSHLKEDLTGKTKCEVIPVIKDTTPGKQIKEDLNTLK